MESKEQNKLANKTDAEAWKHGQTEDPQREGRGAEINRRPCLHLRITMDTDQSGGKAWGGDGSLGGVDGGKGGIWNTLNNEDKTEKEKRTK